MARRWGGWFWIEELLRQEAWARAALDAEREIDAPREDPDADIYKRFGTDPWRHDSHDAYRRGIFRLQSLYLPVAVLDTDLKSNVQQRAWDLVDAVWERYGIRTPRNTGVTASRLEDWQRFIGWLWEDRVERIPRADVGGGAKSLPAVTEGIGRALAVLSSR